MKIIISPAKQINDLNDFHFKSSTPHFINKANNLYQYLKSLDYANLKTIMNASDKICHSVINNLNRYDIQSGYINALMAYDGIQYKMMQPSIMDEDTLEYLNNHLYIVSGLYGLLKPFDLIIPYRLEMQSKIDFNSHHNLYSYWGNELYQHIFKDDDILINLASNEYAKAITPYKQDKHTIINVYFYELCDGNLKEKGVYVKMARGMMVQYIALNKLDHPDQLKAFNELNYKYRDDLSSDINYVFVREKK